jgi:hypothetical protein
MRSYPSDDSKPNMKKSNFSRSFAKRTTNSKPNRVGFKRKSQNGEKRENID